LIHPLAGEFAFWCVAELISFMVKLCIPSPLSELDSISIPGAVHQIDQIRALSVVARN